MIRELEEEIAVLRRRLQDAPRRVRLLEERLVDVRNQLGQASGQNEKLATALKETREQLALLRDEVEKLTAPPNPFGTVVQMNADGTVDVLTSGRKLRVAVEPTVEIKELERGQEVILNEAFNIVDVREFEPTGEVATVKEVIGDGRLIVLGRGDEERVVTLGAPTEETYIRAGDHVRLEPKTNFVLERLERPEVEELVLEEVPDITYEDIGGLDEQIEIIQDAVELPYLHRDRFAEYNLAAPKGVLLYGPPGCGKTLIAKAVANSLAHAVRTSTGLADARSYFLNIKGPELLNKYVGETVHKIREVFKKAREKARKMIAEALEVNKSQPVPAWIEVNRDTLTAKVVQNPVRDDVPHPIQEQLIIELCSK